MSAIAYDVPRQAELGIDGWSGPRWQKCRVVGETPKRYRIEAIEKMRLPGAYRYIEAGTLYLVPKHAIRFT